MKGFLCCTAALLLLGCSPERDRGDGDDKPVDTASVAVEGLMGAATLNASRAAVAGVVDNESYKLYWLELTFAGDGGELSLRLEQTGSPMDAGEFVRYMSAKSLATARWARAGSAWALSDTPGGDPSRVSLSALEWQAGGHVAGTAELKLWQGGADAGARSAQATARFDVHLTGGP